MAGIGENLLSRNLLGELDQHLEWSPVVIVTGARSCGKSTLLGQVAADRDVPIFDLDSTATRAAISQDLRGFLESAKAPVCIDEFQHNLEILDEIKADLNKGVSPGRYVLTGSTRYSMLPHASQSLTGRAHVMTLWPLSQGELAGRRETFVDAIFSDPEVVRGPRQSRTTRVDYENMVLSGGFPLALERPEGKARQAWFRDYVDLVVRRDILPLREVRNRSLLAELVRRLSANSAQVLNVARLADATGQKSQLIGDLIALLEQVFLAHRLESFGGNLGARMRRRPKLHMTDTGVAANLLGVTSRKLRSWEPSAVGAFGHLVETFVVNELMKQAGWSELHVSFSHFRTADGVEVDAVIEADDGRVAAIEVKAGSKIADDDFRGLRLLRDKLGDRFVAGVLVNLGQLGYKYEDRLYVAPADTLWAPAV